MQGYPPRLLALSEVCPQSMLLNRDFWSIKDFVLVKEVGSGAASTVYYAICRKSTQPVAIKMYLKSKLSKLNRRQVEREINIHSSLNHPHIIDFYAAFEDDDRIYLVQEYAAGGDLFDDVKRRGGRLPEREVVTQVLYPYLTALSYLHARGVIHRDIKPENTVFTRERLLKVTDFGLAIAAATERPVTRLGTLDYMAPEVLRCPDKHSPEDNKDRVDLEYDASVDAWAMGVLAYELIVGRPPFGMSCREATMRAIVTASPAIPDWMSPAAADFIRCALQRTPARRLRPDQLLQHPWITAHVGPAAAAATGGLFQSVSPARSHSCSTEAAVAAAAAAAAQTSAFAAAAGGAAAATPASSSKPLFYHSGAPYRHLLPPAQGCNSASASELGGGGVAAAAAAAALACGSDQRPAKRHHQVHRCQSALLAGPAGGVGGSVSAAMGPPGLLAQHGGGAAATQRLYDNMSYWMTDGNGFSRDPLVGNIISVPQQQQQSASVAALAASGAASPIGSPITIGRAQDFFQSQLARAAVAAAAAVATSSGGVSDIGGHGTASVQLQDPSYAHALQLQEQQQQLSALLSQQQQQLQMQQEQIQMTITDAQSRQVGPQQMQAQQRLGGGGSVSGSGESSGLGFGAAVVSGAAAAAALDPSEPPLTAAHYYKLHLEDLRTVWEVGGRAPGNSCRAPPSPRGLSRYFTARHAGRTASSAGAAGAAATGTPEAATANTTAGNGNANGIPPAAVARLLRNGSGSSSSGGSMKRRTPDTHDWDLPALQTALTSHELQLQFFPPVGRGAGAAGSGANGSAAGQQPTSPPGSSSDLFSAAGGAAAYLNGGAPDVAPFGRYAAMASPTAAAAAVAAAAGLALPAVSQLAGSQSLISYGSPGGQRPSRLSKAFRRVDSVDRSEGGGLGFGSGFGAGLPQSLGGGGGGGQGSEGSGSARSATPQAYCSGAAAAAMVAFDQLTLASGVNTAAAAAVINRSTADPSAAIAMMAAAAAIQSSACAGFGGDEADVSGGGGSCNTFSDASNGSSSAAACTAFTGVSGGGTSGSGGSGASACSFGYYGYGGGGVSNVSPGPGPSHRTPSMTTSGAVSSVAGPNLAALRLSLPTSLPRLGVPATAGSATGSTNGGGAGLRSHPLSSPQITPWATPLNSPAAGAGRMPRVRSLQPPGASSSFNALLDLMEAEGLLAAVEGTADGGSAAVAVSTTTAPVGSDGSSGNLDVQYWAAVRCADGTGPNGTAVPMQIDETAAPYLCRTALAAGSELASLAGGSGGAGSVSFARAPAPPAAAAAVSVQQMSPEDRWAAAWAAAAAASGGGGGCVPHALPMTPSLVLGRSGSFGLSASAGGAASGAVHAPSPLGRDQPHQQARATALQQQIRSRSLNRFQLEQMGITPLQHGSPMANVSTVGGGLAAGVAATSPFAVSPPISPCGASSDAAAAGAAAGETIASASSFTGSGGVYGSAGGDGGGAAFGNRLIGQQLPSSAPPRCLPYNAAAAVHAPGTSLWASHLHQHHGMGSVQCGGAAAVASPSPLGLRCSRSRPSNASSDDTSNAPLPYPPAGACTFGGAAVPASAATSLGIAPPQSLSR